MDGRKICPMLAVLLLILCGCADTVKEPPSAEETNDGITLRCEFVKEDGTALSDRTVRFSAEEQSMDYPLDGEGRLTLFSLPREISLTVSVLDTRGEEWGAMEVTLSQGAVIDAAADGEGKSHVCLRKDTEEVSLTFTLHDSGALDCALNLEESYPI